MSSPNQVRTDSISVRLDQLQMLDRAKRALERIPKSNLKDSLLSDIERELTGEKDTAQAIEGLCQNLPPRSLIQSLQSYLHVHEMSMQEDRRANPHIIKMDLEVLVQLIDEGVIPDRPLTVDESKRRVRERT